MSPSSSVSSQVAEHYSRSDLGASILAALSKAGKDIDNLRPEDLAPVDEFHIRGREATIELARAAGISAGSHVLDVGSGVGGASRCLASQFGCRVTGIDLTDDYCRAATMLAERTGLSNLVSYRQCDALNLPFEDGTFDVVWTQHVAMNISDKACLYREMYRVLKPNGLLAINDILAGPAGPVLFPVPWARTPQTSFLVTPDELRRLLIASHFTIASWQDTTDLGREWFTAIAKRIEQTGLPPLGLNVLLGPDFQAMAQNQRRNLEEGRIVVGQIVAKKQ